MDAVTALIPESRTTQAILIGAGIGLVIYFLTKKRYKYPPGPWGPPLIGNLLSLRKAALYGKLMEWEKDYGPVMTVHMGPMRMVFLNRLDVIQEAFIKKSAEFAGRPQLYSVSKFTEGGKDIIFTDYGPTWQLHRRLALKALGHYMKGNQFQETVGEVMQFVLEEMRKEKGTFDIKHYTELIVFNILSKVCFDEKFEIDDREFLQFIKLLDDANKEFGNGVWEDIIPPLRLCPTPKFRNFLRVINKTMEFIYKRVNHHRSTFSPEEQRDFTDAILMAQRDAGAEENPELLALFTDTHVAQTISDIFQAGLDTSRSTLYWTILYIAAHPETQAKIHEEVDSVLGARITPLLSDRSKLPYTEAVLYEGMRIATAAPLGLPHTTTCDTTIGEYEIPKGTVVMANVYAVHHDPGLWEDPHKFKPERFLDVSGKLTHRPEGWMPFSFGKRACLAKSLAEPELHLILAGLYRNFEIRLPEGVTADLTPSEESSIGYFTRPYEVVIKDRFT